MDFADWNVHALHAGLAHEDELREFGSDLASMAVILGTRMPTELNDWVACFQGWCLARLRIRSSRTSH